MNKLSNYIWMDGEYVKWEDAKVHALTHSLHYSGSVFEGIRCYHGRIFLLKEHIDRLFYSAENVGLKIRYSKQEMIDQCYEVIKRNKLSNAYIRPFVWRGSDVIKMYDSSIRNYVLIAAVNSKPEFSSDLKVNIGKWRKIDAKSIDPQSKSSAPYCMAIAMQQSARENGFDDSLLLDMNDNIAEFTVSNVFFIKGQEIVTPVADSFLNGITRQFVIQIADSLGYKVTETRLSLSDIEQFDECFMTGTSAEIRGVILIEIDGKQINFADKNVKLLQQEFAKRVGK